jgi:glycyl-tRNA synthetase
MVQLNENIVGIDSAILMHPTTWKASGHVDAFNDPLIDNKDSKKRFRADVLVEDYCAKIEDKENKEIEKAAKRFGELSIKISLLQRIQKYWNTEQKEKLFFQDWQNL